MTTETTEKLTCEVRLVNPPSGVIDKPTVFEVKDGSPRLKAGPGYIDGILVHFAAALDLATWQRTQWGYFSPVVFGGYSYLFRVDA